MTDREGLRGWLGNASRPDLVLAGIPPVFLVTYLLGARVFETAALPVAIAALASGLLVVDALFRHPPAADVSDR